MTFSLRRKRPITPRGPITSALTAISVLAVWALAPALSQAQPGFPAPPPPAARSAPGVGSVEVAQDDTLIYPRQERIVRTAAQMTGRLRTTEEDIDFFVRTELPDPGTLFQRDSEAQLFERIRQEQRKRPGSGRVTFPQEPIVGKGPYEGRHFHRLMETVEPSYACHRRLLFEQYNFDRYGWDLGAIQPVVGLSIFYYDMVMLPYHIWTRPCEWDDCSSGKCLPGDNVPLLLYPEEFSVTGLAAEVLTFWGGAYIFR